MKRVSTNAKRLDEDEIFSLTRDSKVVAIRWDLIEWGLVFDLDVPMSEGIDAYICRAWLIFKGISQIDIPLINTRLPNGFFLTSYINVARNVEGYEDYTFSALIPTYIVPDQPEHPVSRFITIRAKEVCGFKSAKMGKADNYGFLTRNTRLNLISDEEMLSHVISVGAG